MRENYRKPIASIEKLPRFTTMNVIDGQAGLVIYASLIFYSLTIDNILNIIVLLLLAGVSISVLGGQDGILKKASEAKLNTNRANNLEKIKLAVLTSMIDGDNQIDVSKLKTELNKNIDNINIGEEELPIMIQIGDDTYRVEQDGTIAYDTFSANTVTASKGKVTLESSLKSNLKDYKIYGNSVQNGEPSPTNPVEIESVGDLVTDESDINNGKYKIPIKVTGKNILNIDNIKGLRKYDGLNMGKDKYSINEGTINNEITWYDGGYYFEFTSTDTLSAGTYTLSFKSYSSFETGVYVGVRVSDNEVIGSGIQRGNINEWTKKSYTFTITEDKTINGIYLQGGGTASNFWDSDILFKDIQIELGDVATEYEEYKESVTNIYLNEPLRKVGNEADYIDFASKKVIRKINEKELKSSLDWNDNGLEEYNCISIPLSTKERGVRRLEIEAMTNYCPQGKAYYGITQNEGWSMGFWQCTTYWGFNSASDVKEWLNAHNMVVQYVLKVPDDTEVVNLPSILCNNGITSISVDTNIKPSNMEVSYYKSTK